MRSRSRSLVLGLSAACAFTSPAISAEWWYAAESKSDRVYFVDRESVRPAERALGRSRALIAWSMDYEKRDDGTYYKSSVNLWVYDCAELSRALRQFTTYDSSGEVNYSSGIVDYEWRYVIPDTIGANLINFVCNYERGAGDSTTFTVGADTFYYVANPDELLGR
jgi:hypothetical protein